MSSFASLRATALYLPAMRHLAFAAIGVGLLAAGWEPQAVPTRASFRGLSVVDANVVWASGSRATIVRTTDGGRTWTVDSIRGKDSLDLRDIHAFDARTAVAISAGEAEKGHANVL